jgi:hypothetical protein
MIRYSIKPSPFEKDRWILWKWNVPIFGGTPMECAKEIQRRHPDARVRVNR